MIIEQENEVKIKLRVQNESHLPKLDGRRGSRTLGKTWKKKKNMVSAFSKSFNKMGELT